MKTEASHLSHTEKLTNFLACTDGLFMSACLTLFFTYYEVNNYACHGFKIQYFNFAPLISFFYPSCHYEYFVPTKKTKAAFWT